ncbi:MAG: glycosyltransferase family 4 protein [Bacteroidota bacterium]
MKILVVNWQDIRNPLAGGAEVHLHQVFSRIAAAGNEVTVLCSAFAHAPAVDSFDGMTIIRRGSRSFFHFGVERAYRELRARRAFDVVVDDMNKIPFMAQRFVREPVCGIAHHLFGSSIFREVDPVTATYVSWMERRALKRYRNDAIPFIAVSPSTREDLIRRGYPASLIHMIPLAVDHSTFRPAPELRSSTPLLGYLGRIKRYKSIDHLIEALPRVREKVPGTRLTIVGEGDDRPRLQRLVNAMGLNDAVTFTGFVEEGKKVALLQSVWTLVMPSSKEGWGLNVTEANACGTVAVASDVPGLRDAVIDGETGFLFPYGDRNALAERIVEILANREKREEMGAKAWKFSQQFSWDVAAKQTIEVLAQVAGAH